MLAGIRLFRLFLMAHPIPAQFPRICTNCKVGIPDGEAWAKLKKIGETVDVYCRLEMRNCDCGSTLAVIVEVIDPTQE